MPNAKRTDNLRNRALILLFCLSVLIFLVDVYFLALYFFQDRASFFNWSKNISAEQANHQLTGPSAENSGNTSNSETAILDLLNLTPPVVQTSSSSPASATPAVNMPTLYLGSFGYSIANIDGTKTNLYFDDTVKGIMFPVNYEWQTASDSLVAKEKNNFSDLSCLGKNCLEQRNEALYYNGRALAFPAEIKRVDIAAVSVGVLNKRWLVGFTLKNGRNYNGAVYYFDGQNFSRLITPEPIKSPYFGLFGFGGEDQDFVFLYGGAEGIAYQVKGNKLINLNKFFNLRTMDDGFRAGIIRAAYGDNVNWYVYNQANGRPRLIKLWQNRGAEIVGATAFTDLFSGSEQQALFKIESVAADKIRLLARLTGANGELSWKVFSDNGFKNNFSGVLTTSPQSHDGNNSEIIIRKVANSQVTIDEKSRALFKFSFSTDGQEWRDLPIGQGFDFVTPRIKHYFLKLVFPPVADRFSSPYISNISFDYQCEKF